MHLPFKLNLRSMLASREFGTVILLLMALLLNPVLGLEIPQDNIQLLLGSCAVLLFTYGLEKAIYVAADEISWPLDNYWYESRRFGLVVIAFATVLINAYVPDLSNYAVQTLIAIFGIVGVFGFSLEDIGEAVRTYREIGKSATNGK